MPPKEFSMSDFAWKDGNSESATLIYRGFSRAVSIPMYREPLRPAGTVLGAPQEGEEEDAYTRLGGQAGLLQAADKFATEYAKRKEG